MIKTLTVTQRPTTYRGMWQPGQTLLAATRNVRAAVEAKNCSFPISTKSIHGQAFLFIGLPSDIKRDSYIFSLEMYWAHTWVETLPPLTLHSNY